jgi:hypothetical protein
LEEISLLTSHSGHINVWDKQPHSPFAIKVTGSHSFLQYDSEEKFQEIKFGHDLQSDNRLTDRPTNQPTNQCNGTEPVLRNL